MIESVRVINDNEIDVTIPVTNAYKTIQIYDIKGLGPVTAQINSTAKGQGAGSTFSSSSIGNRNVVFGIQLHGNDIETSRRTVYQYFPIGDFVRLIFRSGNDFWLLYGYVESVTPEIFTKVPSMQVSVVCVDPFFRRHPNSNSIEVSPLAGGSMISYQGTVDTGVDIEIQIKPGDVPSGFGNIFITQQTPGKPNRSFGLEDFDINRLTQGKLSPGDLIKISTSVGKKKATLTRNGVNYNILPALKDELGYFLNTSTWPLLQVRRFSTFTYRSNRYINEKVSVNIHWEDLREGL